MVAPLEKYETAGLFLCKEKQRSCRERECTGWKATGQSVLSHANPPGRLRS